MSAPVSERKIASTRLFVRTRPIEPIQPSTRTRKIAPTR